MQAGRKSISGSALRYVQRLQNEANDVTTNDSMHCLMHFPTITKHDLLLGEAVMRTTDTTARPNLDHNPIDASVAVFVVFL